MTRFRIIVAAVCAAAVVLAGCEATDSFAHDPEKAKTRKGAGYGAAAGAVVGLLTGGSNPFKSAMIGAAAGALAGGAVGYYMDKQEAKLRQQMAGTGVDVVRNGDNITLDMPGSVTFAFDSSDLNAQFYPVLDKVAGTLKEYDKTVIEVAGHTDSVGSDTYNQGLSERRANNVASYLVEPRRDAHAHGDDRRGRSASGGVERNGRRSRPEPPRRDHDRPGDPGRRREGEAGLTKGPHPPRARTRASGGSRMSRARLRIRRLPARRACAAS